MANILFQDALIVGTQVDELASNANADVLAATQVYTSDIEGTPDYTDAQGVKVIDGTFAGAAARRRSLLTERVQASGTADGEFLLGLEGPETMTFQTRLQGSGHDTPVADGDFDWPPAIRFLFEGLGLRRFSVSGSQSLYRMGEPTYLTFTRFTGDDTTLIRYRYGSCLVQSASIVFSPAEAALVTWTVMVGHLNARIEAGVFPPFPDASPPVNTVGGYGKMDTEPPAPFVASAAMVGGQFRRPGEITLTITQGLERVGNANNTNNGMDIFPTRENGIQLAGDFFLIDADPGQEFEDMELPLQLDDYSFTLGSVAANTSKFTLFNATDDGEGFAPIKLGNQYVHTVAVHGTAVGKVGGSEFEILNT